MLQRFLCPVMVSRDAELSALEDALLSANRGDARFVLLEGEAGMGKSRLATAIMERARKLGNAILSGGCTEADVALPYLPFIEAIGNYIATQDIRALAERLGGSSRELTQLFPQLSFTGEAEEARDPTQAKLRLFEAVVSLLSIPASERGLLLLVEDVHWADPATRELLDHIARRSTGMRILCVVTYRSDEIDRRHPLQPLLQAWRRSGVGERVKLEGLTKEAAAAMIGAILDEDEVSDEFRDLMHARAEGNPFVLEEMLKEAIDRGDVFRTPDGTWDRRAVEEMGIPETVKDTILLRVGRFVPECIEVLQAASVLGRVFAYRTLVDVSEAAEDVVQRALAVAIGQQLVDEDGGAYRWRHALTQEAIYDDIVTPRRQMLHSRAADVHAKAGDPPVEIAFHLLGAARFAEAVPACMQAAAEAEQTFAWEQAIELYERVLGHVSGREERGRLLCRLGIAYWSTSQPARAEPHLDEGITLLEQAGLAIETGRPLTTRGRCRWELNRTPEAWADFDRARALLENAGSSADLALVYLRIAGLHGFQLEFEECLTAAERAVEIATTVGADFERVWAKAFVMMGLMGTGRVAEGIAVEDEAYHEAVGRGYHYIVSNLVYNDIWTTVHMMLDRLDEGIRRAEALPQTDAFAGTAELCRSNARRVKGELEGALADSAHARELIGRLGFAKFVVRTRINSAEVLYEMGRFDDAWRMLPQDGGWADLQDIAYEAAVQLRLRIATDRLDEAVEIARTILERGPVLAPYRETLALAAETFVEAGLLDEARAVLEHGRAHPTPAGMAFLDLADAQLQLADGDPARAGELARAAAGAADAAGFRLVSLRARTVVGAALARAGDREGARETLQAVSDEAVSIGAMTIANGAVSIAAHGGLEVVAGAAPVAATPAASVPVGERLITSVFADVRNYTQMTSDTAPHQMADKIATLYRWAAAEVERHGGVVNRFAGDAVMATFNVGGTSLEHTLDAVRAAMTLRDKAALADLPIGIGIGVGSAVVGTVVEGQDMMVTGVATNLAARLQTAAEAGEIILSDEAFRRAGPWLAERGIGAAREELTLKGFDGPQVAYRLPARAQVTT